VERREYVRAKLFPVCVGKNTFFFLQSLLVASLKGREASSPAVQKNPVERGNLRHRIQPAGFAIAASINKKNMQYADYFIAESPQQTARSKMRGHLGNAG